MDTLAFWMYSADGQINSLSFGKSPRRSSDDVALRVFNASANYTARQVTVTLTGERATSYYLSLDGDNFAAAVDLGDLAPGDFTAAITLRRVTPADAPLGTETVQAVAAAASWTTT